MSCEIQVGGHIGNSPRFVALVDAADAELVGAYHWSVHQGYAARLTQDGDKRQRVYLHRLILGLTPGDGVHVDHISGDKLDNRRENLRVCTHAQNMQNFHNRPYRGAAWDASRNCWQAQATLAGKQHHLGRYATQEEAAAVAAAFRRAHMPYSRDARAAATGVLVGRGEGFA
jgi:hypothetical protein